MYRSTKNAVGGFDYYDTVFKVGNLYFEATINIENTERGRLFKDVTKIKDVTEAIMNSYGQSPKFQFLRTSSTDSVSQNQKKASGNSKKSGEVTYSLSKDSAGNTLSERQKEFFEESKTRDSDGNLMVLYHQTDGNFTEFDTHHEGAGSYDHETPYGVFLKPTAKDIGMSGKKQMPLYAMIKRPLHLNDRTKIVYRSTKCRRCWNLLCKKRSFDSARRWGPIPHTASAINRF